MPVNVNGNERSFVIDLISKINEMLSNADLTIKKAGGENTISLNNKRMFPDVILFANREQSVILQGWEAKMPDVLITDTDFISDAKRKARALNLNSCLLWNFTYAVLYVLDENTDDYLPVKTWTDTSYIRTREDVLLYKTQWEYLLKRIILELNQLFLTGVIKKSGLGEVLTDNIISLLIRRNKDFVSEYLKERAVTDVRIDAYIGNWWKDIHIEYKYDEQDQYKAYAKNIILNWVNRILFAHIIKRWQNSAFAIDTIGEETTPDQASIIFENITNDCDFFNIFSSIQYDTLLPDYTWADFVELSLFMKENGTEFIDQNVLQNVLENTVNSAKREINGQYATPIELAKILVKMTIRDYSDNVLDPCCGTGTIAREVLQAKKRLLNINEALATVWASDKNKFLLQITNISMASYDTIRIPSIIFQHNALSLKLNETIRIINPSDGSQLRFHLPEFGSVITNLPFVRAENISDEDKILIQSVSNSNLLDNRTDLYGYIILALYRLLKNNGRLGIIISNSWLGTISGGRMMDVLQDFFTIKQVHISGNGRWFSNADVVTTILILEKESSNNNHTILFYLWGKTLEELENNSDWHEKLVNSSILEEEIDDKVVKLSRYTSETLSRLRDMNISYNALFHNIDWLLDISDKTVQIDSLFLVKRGSRRGWDRLFYPAAGHNIEQRYIRPVLINARNVNYLIAEADSEAFCCGKTINELTREGSSGTISWIRQFEEQVNGTNRPLPEVLSRPGMQWYELQENEIAEIFTTLNPDNRIFFAKFITPSFINQRLIGLKQKECYDDLELEHALLNSVFTMFYIEASGFGRGLSVLDINSKHIKKCRILNPQLLSIEDRNKIVNSFRPLLNREIRTIRQELSSVDRMIFEITIMRAFGIERYLPKIIYSLLSLQNMRHSAQENVEPFDSDDGYGYADVAQAVEDAYQCV